MSFSAAIASTKSHPPRRTGLAGNGFYGVGHQAKAAALAVEGGDMAQGADLPQSSHHRLGIGFSWPENDGEKHNRGKTHIFSARNQGQQSSVQPIKHPNLRSSMPPAAMALQQALHQMEIITAGEGFTDITTRLNDWVASSGVMQGVLNLTLLHTSASLTINENADPRVLKDLAAYLKALVPEEGVKPISGNGHLRPYCHADEGPDDMPAHIRTALTCSTMGLSIDKGRILLGTWQAIYLWEHRRNRHKRRLAIHAIGEAAAASSAKVSGSSASTMMARRNGSKLNELVQQRHNHKAWAEDGGVDTDVDLLIDRLHEIAGEDKD